jgi:hypothetical protein
MPYLVEINANSFIYSTMALQLFVGSRPRLQFRNFFTQTVGILGRVISPSQGRYLHSGQHKHRIYAQTNIHVLSGIRTHDRSVRASEDSSCFRPRGHCNGKRCQWCGAKHKHAGLEVLTAVVTKNTVFKVNRRFGGTYRRLTFQRTTRHYIPEDGTLQTQSRSSSCMSFLRSVYAVPREVNTSLGSFPK